MSSVSGSGSGSACPPARTNSPSCHSWGWAWKPRTSNTRRISPTAFAPSATRLEARIQERIALEELARELRHVLVRALDRRLRLRHLACRHCLPISPWVLRGAARRAARLRAGMSDALLELLERYVPDPKDAPQRHPHQWSDDGAALAGIREPRAPSTSLARARPGVTPRASCDPDRALRRHVSAPLLHAEDLLIGEATKPRRRFDPTRVRRPCLVPDSERALGAQGKLGIETRSHTRRSTSSAAVNHRRSLKELGGGLPG